MPTRHRAPGGRRDEGDELLRRDSELCAPNVAAPAVATRSIAGREMMDECSDVVGIHRPWW